MDNWQWLATAVLAFLGYIFYKTVYKWESEMRKMYPTASIIPIFGIYIELFRHRADVFAWFEEMAWYCRRSFCLSILGTNYIVPYQANDLEKIIGVSKHLEKADLYNYLHDWLGRGLLTSFGERWKKSRKILTPAFHFNILENFIEVFHRNGEILHDKLMEHNGKSTFNVYELIKLYALDNICECAMGIKINAQLNPNGDYVTAIGTLCETIFHRMMQPWLWPNIIFSLSPEGRKNKVALKIVHQQTRSVIEKRKKEFKLNQDKSGAEENDTNIRKKKMFIDILLSSNEAGGLTSEEIREEIDTFMFEGHDTISSTLSFAMYLLSQHPDYQQKAYEEQMALLGDDDRKPSLQDLNDMKLLEMIIKETLRLYPAVPAMARLLEEDIVFDEKTHGPKGSYVLIIPSMFHQNLYVWEKPTEFYPEHFELEAAAKRHPYQFIPFSSGPRNCIGMRFAMYEMKAALSSILRKVELLPCDPPAPVQPTALLILKSKNGINIRVQERRKT